MENNDYIYNNNYEDNENFYYQDFDEMPHITVALSGASGLPYGLRLIECLLTMACRVSVVYSNAAVSVASQECGLELPIINRSNDTEIAKNTLLMCFQNGVDADLLSVYAENDFFSPLASGSSCADAMVVCPCSMGNLAKIAHGISDSLIARAADVIIKERKPLILVPREMPFSTLHLQNMLELSKVGAVIMPPCPGFYLYPQNIGDMIDFVVSRILEQINLSPKNVSSWSKVLLNTNAEETNNFDNSNSNNLNIFDTTTQNLPTPQIPTSTKTKDSKKNTKYSKTEKVSKVKAKTKTKTKRNKTNEVSETNFVQENTSENEIAENISENFTENNVEKIISEPAEITESPEIIKVVETTELNNSDEIITTENNAITINPNDIDQNDNNDDEDYDFW